MFDWLQLFADWLIYGVFSIEQGTHPGDALNFFVYDTIKILILLFAITFIMGIVNAYFPVERIRSFLSRRKLYGLEYLLLPPSARLRRFARVRPCRCLSALSKAEFRSASPSLF